MGATAGKAEGTMDGFDENMFPSEPILSMRKR